MLWKLDSIFQDLEFLDIRSWEVMLRYLFNFFSIQILQVNYYSNDLNYNNILASIEGLQKFHFLDKKLYSEGFQLGFRKLKG